MPLLKPELNDSIEVLIKKTKILSSRLDAIIYREAKTADTQFYMYTPDECLVLQGKLLLLITELNAIPVRSTYHSNHESENRKIEILKKRVLFAAIEACSKPTPSNCSKLKELADELPGHGDFWARVGHIVFGIFLLFLGIIPGVCYLSEVFRQEEWGLWNQTARKGSSESAAVLANEIQKTQSYFRVRNGYSFFPVSVEIPEETPTVSIVATAVPFSEQKI